MGKSCLKVTFFNPKYNVGPSGKWHNINPSGSPLCSCKIIKSVKSYFPVNSTKSFITYAPLFTLIEFGTTRHISYFIKILFRIKLIENLGFCMLLSKFLDPLNMHFNIRRPFYFLVQMYYHHLILFSFSMLILLYIIL